MKKQMLALMAAAIGIGASAGEALWMRDVKISRRHTDCVHLQR